MACTDFNDEESTRYRGHISLCEIGYEGQKAIYNAKVLIVGAGGLGSPVSLYLAAAGVGNIGIMDADKVSLSNLQRQIMHGTDAIGTSKVESAVKAMHKINPHPCITAIESYLTDENIEKMFADYELIIDCTDNFKTRRLINDTCVRIGKPFIFGAVSRFSGQVFTHIPGSADYRSFFGDEIPENSEPCSVKGILNTVVGITGTLQATEAIKYLTKTGDLLTDRLLIFDALSMQFNTLHSS